jgi:hypothetical protein
MTQQLKEINPSQILPQNKLLNRDDTVFLRFIAICLILNSHLDLYYPIAYIGTGGSIGNALFFMLSAFGLYLSEKKSPQTFIEYGFKRIGRIYPSVWIVLIFLVYPVQHVQNILDDENLLSVMGHFLCPPFWFLQVLLLYHFIGFFLIKKDNKRGAVLAMGIAFVAYLFVYLKHLDLTIFSIETMPFKVLFYNMTFILGIIMARMNEKIRYSGFGDIFLCLVSILTIYAHKYLMTKNIFSEFQIIQHVTLLVLIPYALKVSRSSFILDFVMQIPGVGRAIRYVSGITLELYIVHVAISPLILRINLPFPLNALIFLCVSLAIASVVKRLAGKITLFSALHAKFASN